MPKILLRILTVVLGLFVFGIVLLAFVMAIAYPSLPDLSGIKDYRPKMPLRVYTADNVLIGEFGEERRNVISIKDVPPVLKNAILSAEDDSFYEHSGVDMSGILRALINNMTQGARSQGGSTITMQVARNFYLSSEKTYMRKLYEILLSYKIEKTLTKDQILELYINQIYLGQRAYGFSSAARIYFGKPIAELTTEEAAMLAGIPKAPSRYNPVINPTRATLRQQYVLRRMHELGKISTAEWQQAKQTPLNIRQSGSEFDIHAEYAAELARQLVYEQYKEQTYTLGLNVHTTILSEPQNAAYQAIRKGILDYDRRHGYNGPEAVVDLAPGIENNHEKLNQATEDVLDEHPDNDSLLTAVVLEASPNKVVVARNAENVYTLTGNSLRYARGGLAANASDKMRLRRGAVIRLFKNAQGEWDIMSLPNVQAALVSLTPEDGAIRALVGGFDFHQNKFDHARQAYRQPGSGFKPFIYAAGLEKGIAPTTMISDGPFIWRSHPGAKPWTPKNSDGKFGPPMTMRRGLTYSRNMVTIRVLDYVTPEFAQQYITRFGFSPTHHPAYLTMGLGAGSATPLEMARGYAILANGGYKVNPYIISSITDQKGKVLWQAKPKKAGDESIHTVDSRVAYIMTSMLRDVVRQGTATRANVLQRNDMAGKTGTTNKSVDIWFNGYTPDLVAVVWMGFDQPKSLGASEFGGTATVPIWAQYMQVALKNFPQRKLDQPPGIINANGDYYLSDFPPGQAVGSISTNLGEDSEGTGRSSTDPVDALIEQIRNEDSSNSEPITHSAPAPTPSHDTPPGTST